MMMMRWRGRVLARRIWARSLHLDAATSQCLTHHQHTTLALASKVYITHSTLYQNRMANGIGIAHKISNVNSPQSLSL